ncbi:MAG: cob(I)yrinic acid a,c-diamide adenosyltransferase [Candidatus Eisenbacteria bacterium]
MARIYTRGGDKGDTALFGGGRVRKNDLRVAAYGAVDELSCALGAVLAEIEPKHDAARVLEDAQHHLFRLGGVLADPEGKAMIAPPGKPEVEALESAIDRLEEDLPALKQFILPGGCRAGAALHLSRSVCRRAERAVVDLVDRGAPVPPEILIYLNRLSDYLFVAARSVNRAGGRPGETVGLETLREPIPLIRAACIGLALISFSCLHCDRGTDPDEIDVELSTLWPNGDGSSWTFRVEERTVYDSVPALAGFDPFGDEEVDYLDLAARLDLPIPDPAHSIATESNTLRYRFEGTVSTEAGPKQKLVMARIGKTEGRTGSFDDYVATATAASSDLAESIPFQGPPRKRGVPKALVGPLFRSGEIAFEGQDDWIGYYPSPDWGGSDPSFTVVQAPLRPGASFRQMLGGTLSDDFWEYGWIVGERTIGSPAGRIETVRIVYLFDLGESDIINENGEWLGTFRSYAISTLDLAPDVGPVFQRDYLTIPGINELGIPTSTVCREMSLLDYDLQ